MMKPSLGSFRFPRLALLIALISLSGAAASGCGHTAGQAPETQEEGQEAAQDSFDTEAEVIAKEDAELSGGLTAHTVPEREVVDGKVRSYFTGEWIDEELGTQRPLAVMLNNTSAALPMSGVSNASVIYECPVEGRITRWMGIFEDWRDLERIGSVRSCRLYYLHFAQEFDAVYAHFGQASYAKEALNSGEFDVLSGATKGIDDPAAAMYGRISRPGRATEHTLYAFPDGIKKDIERKGFDMEMPADYPGKFRFAQTGEPAEYEGYPEATVLKPGGNGGRNGFGGVKAVFEYNPADRKYYRSTYGSPHVDELTGEQVAVTNVIFQYCDGNVLDAKDYLHFASQSQGNRCTVFTNGKRIEGCWSNPGELGTPARYYDKNDQEITLNTGTTFICIIWNDYAEDVVIV